MSLYDITESAPENTVPKYRRNGARYGQTACVGGCVDRWSSSTCYYFNDIIKIQDFDFNNILLDQKSCENILIYDVFLQNFDSRKTFVHYVQLNGWVY